MTEDPYVDITALAAYTTLSERQLRRYAADPIHPLPRHHIGRRVLFLKSEFDTWLRQHEGVVRRLHEDSDVTRAARGLLGWPAVRRRRPA